VHWHNTTRVHGYLDDRPPAEYEQAFYAAQRDETAVAFWVPGVLRRRRRAGRADRPTRPPRAAAVGAVSQLLDIDVGLWCGRLERSTMPVLERAVVSVGGRPDMSLARGAIMIQLRDRWTMFGL
jgi:hypothetical protein